MKLTKREAEIVVACLQNYSDNLETMAYKCLSFDLRVQIEAENKILQDLWERIDKEFVPCD